MPPRRRSPSRVRRRRIAALATLVALAGGILALTLAFGSGGDKPASTTTATHTTPAKQEKPHPTERQRKAREKLEAAADRAAQRFAEIGVPLYCGAGTKKLVALTFDDGPSIYTERYLFPRLRKANARATFFMLGRRIAEYPQAPVKALELGAVGDHTWNHSMLTGLNRFAIKAEIGDTQQALARATGHSVSLFRPPYGAHDATVDREVQSYGMLEVMWSVDSFDWKGSTWKEIVRQVMDSVEPGSIVLMHDIQQKSMQALPTLLRSLHRAGYRMVTVPELLALDPPTNAQLEQGIEGCKAQATGSQSGA